MLKENQIFGFKLRYLRMKQSLTYDQLSKKSGLSLSYISEVEKGKKYPTVGKIKSLAEALGTSYEDLVSLKVDKKISMVVDLLTSDVMEIFPEDFFGINSNKLFELFSAAPDKTNAIVSAVHNVARKYQMDSGSFYKSALRSFQDMHDNYFKSLETAVARFKEEYDIPKTRSYSSSNLEETLLGVFGIQVNKETLERTEHLSDIRSYFSEEKKTLYINSGFNDAQISFLLLREIAFQYLELKERPKETRIMDVSNFNELLNNFKASYFAAAFLMDEELLLEDLEEFFRLPSWNPNAILGLLSKYQSTPEMFLQRLSNLLPTHFGWDGLFFLRLTGERDMKHLAITKEIHLSRLHSPYGNENAEHYCRKWVSATILPQIKGNSPDDIVADAQVSEYWQSPNQYLCISLAKPNKENQGVSVTLGLMVNDQLRRVVRFLGDPDLRRRTVHTTCERCSMVDCNVRQAAPIYEEKKQAKVQVKLALDGLDA